jgi:hypothetical protein
MSREACLKRPPYCRASSLPPAHRSSSLSSFFISSSTQLLLSESCRLGAMRCRPFEEATGRFDGSFSNAHFSRLIIISHHRLQSLPPLSPRLKPPEADSIDLTTSIVNQSLVSIKNPACNAYLFNFLVSHAPFCIICHPLTISTKIFSPCYFRPRPLFCLHFLIVNPACNTYLFIFSVSRAPFHVICHPLTCLQRYSLCATFNLTRSFVYIF